jgi:predicted dehydrogenase
MAAKYRVGIIGCGGISQSHASAWSAIPSVEMVAAADVIEENVKARADHYKIPARYTDPVEMLRKEKPDIVSVCTTTVAHVTMTIAAAEAGVKAILCEKPMAPDLQKADEMVAACEKSGAKLAIAHQRRFMPDWVAAREMIVQGAIGVPILFYWRTSGGLINNGSHAVDTMRFFLGDAKSLWVLGQVGRKTDRYERGVRIEDFASFTLCFENGTRGVVEVDVPAPEANGENPLFIGTEGMITIGKQGLRILDSKGAEWRKMPFQPANAFVGQATELIKWLEGGPEHRNSGRRSRRTIEVLMAVYESARRREPVTLPLPSGPSPLEAMIDDGTLPVSVPGKNEIRPTKVAKPPAT